MPAVRIDQTFAPFEHSCGLKMKVRGRAAARVARCADDIAHANGIADGDVNPVEMTLADADDVGGVRARLDHDDACTIPVTAGQVSGGSCSARTIRPSATASNGVPVGIGQSTPVWPLSPLTRWPQAFRK